VIKNGVYRIALLHASIGQRPKDEIAEISSTAIPFCSLLVGILLYLMKQWSNLIARTFAKEI
jgi:hypothetical protein